MDESETNTGSLHCAAHGETVRRFGPDDFLLLAGKRTNITADSSAALRNDNKRTDDARDKDSSRSPSGMTTRKAKATAKAMMR
jgi:hypothetical protein